MVCLIGLLSTTWLGFQNFTLLYIGKEGWTKASSTSIISSCGTAVMVDNLVEKVDECSLNRGVKYCLRTIGTTKAVWYTTLQGLLKY